MAYFPDLTPYSYLPGHMAALNVGWLDVEHPYRKGFVTSGVVDRLREFAVVNPVNQTRGFHCCELCRSEDLNSDITVQWKECFRKLGSAEIWVTSRTGVSYAAPDLISHYIESHGYMPPDIFLEALSGVVLTKAISLSERVLAVADNPVAQKRDAFYEAFLRSHVGVQTPNDDGTLSAGNHIATGGDNFTIPMGKSPDGGVMLIVTADIGEFAKHEKGSTFIELDAADVVKMAIRQNAGIIVQASYCGRKVWAGILREDVVSFAAIKNKERHGED